MDFNALEELQAELAAAQRERASLIKQVSSPQDGSSDEDDAASSSPPAPPAASLPPPPMPAHRKVLNWGVASASNPQPKQRNLHSAPPSRVAAQASTLHRPSLREGGALSESPTNRDRAAAAGNNPILTIQTKSEPSLVPPGAQAAAPSADVPGAAASTSLPMEQSTHAAAGDAATSSSSGASAGRRAGPPTHGCSVSAARGVADEEAVRRAVLREVLAVMLGPQAAHKVDCYQLDIQTVAAVAQQRSAASRSGRQDEPDKAGQRLAREQADKAAAQEARSRAEKELAAAKAAMEQERTQLRRKAEASKREADALNKEKRDLMAKLGQQGREARAAVSNHQEAQERVARLEQQVAVQQRAAATAQKSLEQARAGVGAAEAAVAAAKREAAEAREACEQQAQQSAQDATQLVQAALGRAHAAHEATLQQATAALAASCAEVDALSTALQDAQQEQQQGQQDVQLAVAAVAAEVAHMRPRVVAEVQELQLAMRSTMSDLEDRCQVLGFQCIQRTAKLLEFDAQVATLGPEGVKRLYREVREAQQRQADAEADSRQQAIKLARCEASRSKLATEKQVQGAELAVLVKQQAELKRELAACKAALGRSKSDVQQLTHRATQLAQAAEQLTQRATVAEGAAAAAEEAAEAARREAQEAKVQQEGSQAECDALREQAQLLQQEAAAGFTTGAQHAAAAAAKALKALRDKYFQAPLVVPPPQQQQQQQPGSGAAGLPVPQLKQPPVAVEGAGSEAVAVGNGGSDGSAGGAAAATAAAAAAGACAAAVVGAAAEGASASSSPPQLVPIRPHHTLPSPPSATTQQQQPHAPSALAASAARDDAFGLRLCHLTLGSTMDLFQEYCTRQAQIEGGVPPPPASGPPAVAALAAAAALRPCSVHGGRAGSAAGAAVGRPKGPQRHTERAVEEARAGVVAECSGGVELELLWLEGCLLLVLLEAQQQAQQQERLQAAPGGEGAAGKEELQGLGGEKAVKKPEVLAEGSAVESHAVKDLVGQMMRAMARDRRQLQQRLHQLEAQAAPARPPPSPSPLSLYPPTFAALPTPTRRSVSAHTPSSSAPLRPSSALKQPRLGSASSAVGPMPAAAARPPGIETGLPSAAAGARVAGVGIRGLLMHQPLVDAADPAGGSPEDVPAGAAAPPPGWQGAGGEGGISAAAPFACQAAPSSGEGELDDVWQVLEALEESGLRSSRGMFGLGSAGQQGAGGSRKRLPGDAGGISRQAAASSTSFRPGLRLTPGQAFVAKYRDASAAEGKARKGSGREY